MAKEKVDPNHHEGKRTGYTLKEGRYYLAPVLRKRIDLLLSQEESIERLLNDVLRFCHSQTTDIAQKKQTWWKDVGDDLDLDIDLSWRYVPMQGYIEQRNEPKQDAGKGKKEKV